MMTEILEQMVPNRYGRMADSRCNQLLKAKEYPGRPSTTKYHKHKDLHDPTTTKTKNPRRIGPTG
jgi:hypothetical protein